MKLTHRAKGDFEIWFRTTRATPAFRWWMLIKLDSGVQNALIIEWFDSVGIYILPQLWETTMKWNYRISDNYMSDFYFSSRQEATEKAIEQANLIYNDRA